MLLYWSIFWSGTQPVGSLDLLRLDLSGLIYQSFPLFFWHDLALDASKNSISLILKLFMSRVVLIFSFCSSEVSWSLFFCRPFAVNGACQFYRKPSKKFFWPSQMSCSFASCFIQISDVWTNGKVSREASITSNDAASIRPTNRFLRLPVINEIFWISSSHSNWSHCCKWLFQVAFCALISKVCARILEILHILSSSQKWETNAKRSLKHRLPKFRNSVFVTVDVDRSHMDRWIYTSIHRLKSKVVQSCSEQKYLQGRMWRTKRENMKVILY